MKEYKLFINGAWKNSVSGETFDDFNPFTGDLYAKVAKAGVDDADLALAAAYQARATWAHTVPAERAKVIFKAADILGQRMMEFTDVLTQEGGGTFGKVMFEVSQTIDLLQTVGGDCRNILGGNLS